MSPPLLRMVLTIDDTVVLLMGWVPSQAAVQPPFESTNESM